MQKIWEKIVLDLTEWPDSNETPGGKWSPIYWMSELNMRCVQKKIKNIIPISHLLNEYYSACNTLQLPPLIDISDEKWNCFKAVDLIEVNQFDGYRIIFAGTPAKKIY